MWKPVVGTNVFAHESGIHADGVLKNPKTYEVFSPDEVGLERQIVVGQALRVALHRTQVPRVRLDIPKDIGNALLPRVRSMAIQLKRPLFDKELVQVYEEYLAARRLRRSLTRGGSPLG